MEHSAMGLWIFAYGSLLSNPGFEYDEKIIGFIKHYRRVFDLACIDHRGTPDFPARTCTLEEEKEAVCWGVAYSVKGGLEKERAILQYLERRECEYDLKVYTDFYREGEDSPTLTGVMLFISTPDEETNKYYLGPASVENMASQIAEATGPCGNNRDYLFHLEKALFDIGHEDSSVIELANEVRKVLGRRKRRICKCGNVACNSMISTTQMYLMGNSQVTQ
ncbi:hypothetical protein AMTR_s00007p00269310 [Amborella trichopoda]|uniref:glutathione-specific gamma-glutamylcyclotransferase n=2 Tax=Amborella trichopoda TaxID=13333 RepID=W1PCB3_AMBTC|nr:hypothetical protein AMTR_s00007p00269310 [Amborella trichopoda]